MGNLGRRGWRTILLDWAYQDRTDLLGPRLVSRVELRVCRTIRSHDRGAQEASNGAAARRQVGSTSIEPVPAACRVFRVGGGDGRRQQALVENTPLAAPVTSPARTRDYREEPGPLPRCGHRLGWEASSRRRLRLCSSDARQSLTGGVTSVQALACAKHRYRGWHDDGHSSGPLVTCWPGTARLVRRQLSPT
jgi:hypothetical protein